VGIAGPHALAQLPFGRSRVRDEHEVTGTRPPGPTDEQQPITGGQRGKHARTADDHVPDMAPRDRYERGHAERDG
jgi:hypothetical protein